MSKAACNQPINGLLLVNKPQGLSSNAVLRKVQHLFKAKKAGHTGSLDPLATGMLPICFGEATKFCQYLLDADKSYLATGLLGIKTDSADAMGQIIAQVHEFDISEARLQQVLSQFTGFIQQTPSMFSALKHQGTPLYKYARKGIHIERPAREVQIHNLELSAFDGKNFTITVSCSKGTYIRNLVEDIGETLGVHAHVTQLHRVYTAGLANEIMYSLEELTAKSPQALAACLLPPERAIDHLPQVHIDDQQLLQLKQGRLLEYSEKKAGLVRLYNDTAGFAGLGELTAEGMLKVKRLLNFS